MPRLARRSRPLLGTFVEVQADHEAAIEAAFDTIARVHRLMSAHDAHSDVSRINCFGHLGPIDVDLWTKSVLERAIFWSRHSEGAFDVVRAGKRAIETGYLPRHEGQPRPKASHWTWLEVQSQTVRLLKPGCLDLGGIAKGFAVDKAVEAMRSAGASMGLVNAGGDMAGFGDRPWRVEIVDPQRCRPVATVELLCRALATSSILPGGACPHLPELSPDLCCASVLAAQAIDADALAKVLVTGSPLAARCLALAGAQGLVVTARGHAYPHDRVAA
ncbi:MAG TPA: FAD:protein FMN transferase [Sphingomicrobium sp.]|nr:FAD:protein FMN transferase [Sphingomicrobium sp.]